MSADTADRLGVGACTPANAHWRAHEEKLVRAFGRDFRPWLRDMVLHADDGRRLTLAGPNGFVRDQVRHDHLDRLVFWIRQFVPSKVRQKASFTRKARNQALESLH